MLKVGAADGARAMQELATKVSVALFAVVLGMAAMMACFAPAAPSTDEPSADKRWHVEESLTSELVQRGVKLPPTARFVELHCSCDRGAHDWGMIKMAPADVARIRREMMREANRSGRSDVRTVTLINSDADLLGPRAGLRPAWWTPTKLPDAEFVAFERTGGSVFVFSEKTGTIYVMAWTA